MKAEYKILFQTSKFILRLPFGVKLLKGQKYLSASGLDENKVKALLPDLKFTATLHWNQINNILICLNSFVLETEIEIIQHPALLLVT